MRTHLSTTILIWRLRLPCLKSHLLTSPISSRPTPFLLRMSSSVTTCPATKGCACRLWIPWVPKRNATPDPVRRTAALLFRLSSSCPVLPPMRSLSSASIPSACPGHPFLHPRCGTATLACLPVTRGTRRHLLLRTATHKQRVPPLGRHRVTGTVKVPSTADCSLSRPINGVPCWRKSNRVTPSTRGTQRVPLRAATYSGRHRFTRTGRVPSAADCSSSRPISGVPC
jgi:hypothetical protein